MILSISLGLVVALVGVILGIYVSLYNRIKRSRNQIENALSSLDALFIKRNELIPNLVAVLEQYTSYEKELLVRITELRQAASHDLRDYQQEGQTDKLLRGLMLQVENYPELKANQQFNNLQYSLNECEEQIAAGRRFLSTSITYYNNSITTFPGNLVAQTCSAGPYQWQRATEEQREKVDVKQMFAK
ncbi:hypothetical protein FACS1894159_02110 [Bacteroidia bacterium]|nr:hypothetical protein FACS1894159_02110 [Bacteroidia bacterium]